MTPKYKIGDVAVLKSHMGVITGILQREDGIFYELNQDPMNRCNNYYIAEKDIVRTL